MQIVRVRLRKPRRVLSYLCADGLYLQRDEPCIVQGEHGPEWGVCVLPPEPCPPDMEDRYNLHVLRRVNSGDEQTMAVILSEERKAFAICLEKIRSRGMPMKLVDAEYSFDQRKVVFYFTADDRVDFRELVRDLAHELRNRIELRHIQVRDEARLVGGLGNCGRQLCCAAWLNDFKPISMRMAKRQNLSLNPSKISGQCGRLLCCLAYENDQYDSHKRGQAPLPQEAPEEEVEAAGLAALEDEELDTEPLAEENGEEDMDHLDVQQNAGVVPESADNLSQVNRAPQETQDATSKKSGRSRRRGRRRRNRPPRTEGS